jgi:hypothetical protein
LPALLPIIQLQVAGMEEVHGELAYHLRAADIEGIDITALGGERRATIDAWVGMQTFLLHRAMITESATGDKGATVWLMDLSAFNELVTIAPPKEELLR